MDLKRNLDTTIAILISLILTGIVLVYVLGTSIINNEQKVEQVKLDIQSEYIRRERYDELLDTYLGIVDEGIVAEFPELLPTHDNFLSVVKELESIATMSNNLIVMRLGDAKLTSEGVELESGSSTIPSTRNRVQVGGTNFDFIEIEATLRGSYSDLEQFINLFGQAKYFMNIDNMVINRVQNDSGTFIDTQLRIHIFVEKLIRVQVN